MRDQATPSNSSAEADNARDRQEAVVLRTFDAEEDAPETPFADDDAFEAEHPHVLRGLN